jgi:hypothetical protein
MEEQLSRCTRSTKNRDPEVNTLPPLNIVRHVRERGTLYIDNNIGQIALIFEWDGPGGDPRRSIRWFIAKRVKYRLRLRDRTQEPLPFPVAV